MNDHVPVITTDSIVPKRRDGYRAYAHCTVYGMPALIEIVVDTHDREYSYAEISVFDPDALTWMEIHRTSETAVFELPIIPNSNLDQLNAVARAIHQAGFSIYATAVARKRQIQVEDAVAVHLAKIEASSAYYAAESAQAYADANPQPAPEPVVAHTGDGQEIPVLIIPTEEETK